MTVSHTLGFPRIGPQRELKFSLEKYWAGKIDKEELLNYGCALRLYQWKHQSEAGVTWLPAGDFSFYDHVLDMSATLGVVPERFDWNGTEVDLDTYFLMARGQSPDGRTAKACAMKKWFDTNYHYIVPEFRRDQQFSLSSNKLVSEVEEALLYGYKVKPVLLGPLTYLWLGEAITGFDKLQLLDNLLPVYGELLQRLAALDVEWVQIDEPILALDLPDNWKTAFKNVYNALAESGPKKLLATYFGELGDNLPLAASLAVDGIHSDYTRAPEDLRKIINRLPGDKIVSAGVIDGRNIWRTDLDARLRYLEPLQHELGERLWLAPSCSLIHVPLDLELETAMDADIKSWLSFARQKLDELALLSRALGDGREACSQQLQEARECINSRRNSRLIRNQAVRQRVGEVGPEAKNRASPVHERRQQQQELLQLPPFPTTTIGSFPQTPAIRSVRREYKRGGVPEITYREEMQKEIQHTIRAQEALGLDVLVHGEPERNDMVEYFGEQLNGFTFSQNAWVHSYGSRCVKPPIIFGDISRAKPMTVEWIRYAQSLTDKPVKGMLTGPVTILNWSFVRDDQPRSETALQLALVLRDEVLELEKAGTSIIQIDEAALREGLPLRKSEWQSYLTWAVDSFRIAAGGVQDSTQIHTHMCYSDFADIIDHIIRMDADVITIEMARTQLQLLESFKEREFNAQLGPGVYDIHSPGIPSTEEMQSLLQKASRYLPASHLWVNPDCGLKTRNWDQVSPALDNMVAAAQALRQSLEPEHGTQPPAELARAG